MVRTSAQAMKLLTFQIAELAERLGGAGFEVAETPFGWFCEWDLAVYGESPAKVWKEV